MTLLPAGIELIGNEEIHAVVAKISRGEGFQSYIISGPEGSGRKTAARLMAQAFVCAAPEGERPCSSCRNCSLASRDIHPDVRFDYRREDKTVYTVEQARALRTDAYITPNEARGKVYVLADAGLMNDTAQNSLLKLLEEPPEYAVFILICEKPDSLLPTVRSRCVSLQTYPLAEDEVLRYISHRFSQTGRETLEKAAAQSGGCIGRAIELLGGDDEQRRLAENVASVLAERDELRLFTAFAEAEKLTRPELREFFAHLSEILHNGSLLKAGAPADPHVRETAEKLKKAFTLSRLAALEQAAAEAYAASAHYIDAAGLLAAQAATFHRAARL